ncbi:hypothetical protein CCUS01_14290 [Colletotrichum cuscutae]|uniref:Uncharacterized protein n=2 Tax=Colletotrichum acutatum species complex TaxID=2707335 RepID=A0AAI9YMU8_9PEZI|nr:uncharacterized protein CCOS01_12434 [Colletotrichum costaricense]KAK1491042.1 hypothetical protein CCUS01_14290 [Colletotrichum cuscutae]KAK1516885.1 hypothetical protein CCOS01_12434 [Colletotrichum costaricense]
MAGENEQEPGPQDTQPASSPGAPAEQQSDLTQEQMHLRGGCIDHDGFCCGVWPADGCYPGALCAFCTVM